MAYTNRGDSGAPQSGKKSADGSVVLKTKAIQTTKFSTPGRSSGDVKEQVPGIPAPAQMPGAIQTTDKSVMPVDKMPTVVDSKPQSQPIGDPKNATLPAADTATEQSFRWTFILLGQSNMAGMGPIAEEDRVPVSNLFKMNRTKEWVSGGEGYNIPASPEGEFKLNAVGEKALGPSRAFGQRLIALINDPRVKIQIINMAVPGSSIELSMLLI